MLQTGRGKPISKYIGTFFRKMLHESLTDEKHGTLILIKCQNNYGRFKVPVIKSSKLSTLNKTNCRNDATNK